MATLMFVLQSFEPDCVARRPPLLMVPGAFSSGRIWQHGFVSYFLDRGYAVHTLTFSGHGRPRRPRLRCGLRWYLNDLRRAVDRIGGAPLVIAHSMGGLTTLRLLAERDLPGAALLSPVPPAGLGRTAVSALRRDLAGTLKWLGLAAEPAVRHLGAPPRGVYGAGADPELVRRIQGELAPESPLALAQLLRAQDIRLDRIRSPLHLYAATDDRVVPAEAVEETAARLGAPLTVFEGMGHTYQAESAWPEVAGDIARWFDGVLHPSAQEAA